MRKAVKDSGNDMRVSYNDSAIFSAIDAADSDAVRARLSELYPSLSVCPRDGFKLAQRFVSIMHEEKKRTTIRYTRNAVEYPRRSRLPVYQVSEGFVVAPEYAGSVNIVGLCYKPFGSLDESDASKDGFPNAAELKAQLREIYGEIHDDEIVSIFTINPEHNSLHGGV
jgi:hypothetical protein